MYDNKEIGNRIKISRIENGKQSMTANEMVKFCKLLNISLDSLINNENLSSEDFLGISKRYIFNEQIDIEERKEVVKKLYIELSDREITNIDRYNQMNKKN